MRRVHLVAPGLDIHDSHGVKVTAAWSTSSVQAAARGALSAYRFGGRPGRRLRRVVAAVAGWARL